MRFFFVSAVFHYLGPAFAVLLFAAVEPLGVAWLRIASAALVFALWRRPWQRPSKVEIMLGLTLAGMNSVFYLAIDRLPLATVGAIEFLAPIALALSRRGLAALGLAVAGVLLLTPVGLTGSPAGFAMGFLNCGLFGVYIVLAKRVGCVDGLARAMLVAAVVGLPVGFADATTAFGDPRLLAAAIGVGVCSSVVPYVCDQLAMARMSRQRFAFLMCLLPATATLIGVVVLRQAPTPVEVAGIALIVCAVALNARRGQANRVDARLDRTARLPSRSAGWMRWHRFSAPPHPATWTMLLPRLGSLAHRETGYSEARASDPRHDRPDGAQFTKTAAPPAPVTLA